VPTLLRKGIFGEIEALRHVRTVPAIRYQNSREHPRDSRVDGKVRQSYVASLGSCALPLTNAGRTAFWGSVAARFGTLSNRIDPVTRAKLTGEIHARIPMVPAG
jgi:hypothetical protein